MRVLLLPLTAVLLLAGCNKPAPAPDANDVARDEAAARLAAMSHLPAITGQINLAGINQLPKAEVNLELRLLDVTDPSQKPVTVEELVAPAPRRLPMDYRLPYHGEKIDQAKRYVIEAALNISGVRLYSTAMPVPVLTDGHSATATLDLVSGGMTATTMSQSELTKAEFKALEGQLGGMQRLTGTRTDDDISVGWDAFKQDGALRMAREQVNLDNEAEVSYRYAYKAGQPWYVVRVRSGVTTQVAWDSEQRVIIAEQSNGNEVSDDDAAALRARAEALAEAIGQG
ncbi:MAG: YbaY family lipoprotein [Lysobacteraceae bacterium]